MQATSRRVSARLSRSRLGGCLYLSKEQRVHQAPDRTGRCSMSFRSSWPRKPTFAEAPGGMESCSRAFARCAVLIRVRICQEGSAASDGSVAGSVRSSMTGLIPGAGTVVSGLSWACADKARNIPQRRTRINRDMKGPHVMVIVAGHRLRLGAGWVPDFSDEPEVELWRRERGGSANSGQSRTALSGQSRWPHQLQRLSTYLHCGQMYSVALPVAMVFPEWAGETVNGMRKIYHSLRIGRSLHFFSPCRRLIITILSMRLSTGAHSK